MTILFSLLSVLSFTVNPQQTEKDTLPTVAVEEWRQTPQPNNTTIKNYAPALLWPSEKKKNGQDVNYKVYLSQDPKFPAKNTIESKQQRFCFFNPHIKMTSGKWYWKYDIINKGQTNTKGIYSFTIKPHASGIETPSFEKFLQKIKKEHPRVMTQGKSLEQIRKEAPNHPVYKDILAAGEKALKASIYKGPVLSDKPAEGRTLANLAFKQISIYHDLLEAYTLSGNKAMLQALIERTDVLLKWPTDDLIGSRTLSALATGYDILYNSLSAGTKEAILKVVKNQIQHGLKIWPGLIEARQVENHFWQMELAGNFIAALATVNDLPASNEMLEYTYELFIARFPNLATQEGGWAEGEGYFGVNKTAVVDMALLLKKIGGVDVFQMNWYKNLADYLLYFAPVGGRSSGFGDMHDRLGYGNIGQSMALVVGEENQDAKARYRFSSLMKAHTQPKGLEQHDETTLNKIEPWYRIVNNIKIDTDKAPVPIPMASAKMFEGVGIAAFHTNVLDSKHNTALYFRSSPFGAKGHMHANQNCFNISRKGEPVFYSTGYYTTFSDPHSLTSYRHTRAHNGILVNGMGQAFGHEGYGWIKRYINGDKIGYVCGDATMAYRPTVDKQFLELNQQNNIQQTAEFGFGDAKLKLFERHMVFLRPDIIVIYDVLESEVPSEWTFLLHTMDRPQLDPQHLLSVPAGANYAEAFVVGSTPLNASVTDQFFSPPIDVKKKYKDLPNQYHTSYQSATKSKGMRFLAVLQLSDAGTKIQKVTEVSKGVYKAGELQIAAEMDALKPAMLTVKMNNDILQIDVDKTTLTEKNKNDNKPITSTNLPLPKIF